MQRTRKPSSTPTIHNVSQQQPRRTPSNSHTSNYSLPSLNGTQQTTPKTTPTSYYNPPHFRATSPLFRAPINRAQTSHSPTRKLNTDTNLFRDIYEIIVLSETYPDLFDRWSEKQKLFTAVIVNITNVFNHQTSLKHDFIEAGKLAFDYICSQTETLRMLLLRTPELQTLIMARPMLIQNALTSLDQFIQNELSTIQHKSYAIQFEQPITMIKQTAPIDLQAAPIELIESTELESESPMSQEQSKRIRLWAISTSQWVVNNGRYNAQALPPAVDEDLFDTITKTSALKY